MCCEAAAGTDIPSDGCRLSVDLRYRHRPWPNMFPIMIIIQNVDESGHFRYLRVEWSVEVLQQLLALEKIEQSLAHDLPSQRTPDSVDDLVHIVLLQHAEPRQTCSPDRRRSATCLLRASA